MSALIFVALALAWAVYLVPQALRHQGTDAAGSTGAESLTGRMRVLARRGSATAETTESSDALEEKPADVVVPGAPAPVLHASAPLPDLATVRRRRAAAKAAARRRRRVLLTLVLVLAVVGALVAASVVGPVWIAVPVALVVAWLLVCRVSARAEQRRRHRDAAVRRRAAARVAEPAQPAPVAAAPAVEPDDDGGPATEEFAVIEADVAEAVLTDDPPAPAVTTPGPGEWAPVAEVLPTYVAKAPAARRSVRTIDLESTGVWTSGRTASDAALAREADEARRQDREDAQARAVEARRRAAGS